MAEDENRSINKEKNCDERTHISINKPTKYGTASKKEDSKKNCQTENEFFIKYEVLNKDTLVSIALKYELKVSQLKSINRMWNSNIIPGQILFIPLTKTLINNYKDELLTRIQVKELLNKCNNSNKSSPDEKLITTPSDIHNVTINDYFLKFDSNFTLLKNNVDRLEKESSLKSINDELSNVSSSVSYGLSDLTKEPELKFIAHSKSATAILIQKEHEKLQDDLFQL